MASHEGEGIIEQRRDQALLLGRRVLEEKALELPSGRLLFLTISGAHAYGFPSSDSDIDLRGAHLLPLEQVIRLALPAETFESMSVEVDGVPIDAVTHDLRKYLALLTRKNGYILEQVFSPLVVHDDGLLEELRSVAQAAITSTVVHHYKGFFRSKERHALSVDPPTLKDMLYLYRVVMTGLHLLEAHEVVVDINRLNRERFGLDAVTELVQRKLSGEETGRLKAREREALLADARHLADQLDVAAARSGLPEHPPNVGEIEELLVRLRLQG